MIARRPGDERPLRDRDLRGRSSCSARSRPTRTVDTRARRAARPRPPGSAAGDEIVASPARAVAAGRDLASTINATKGRPFTIVVDRDGKRVVVGPLRAQARPGRLPRRLPDPRASTGPGESLPQASWQLGPRSSAASRSDTSRSLAGLAGGRGHRGRLERGRDRPRHLGRLPAVGPGLPRRPRPDQPRARAAEPAAGAAARRRPHRDGDPRADPRPRVLAARLPALQRRRAVALRASCSTSACATTCSPAELETDAATIRAWRASAQSA